MNNVKIIEFIESSFLSSLLEIKSITDISYNGQNIFYLDNNLGRMKSNIIVEPQTIKDFVRQIANLCEKQFSFQNPILDVSFGKYRFNAVHQSVAKLLNEDVISFSLRISSNDLVITNESNFLTCELISLLMVLIKSNASIAIGGITGTGKTELQKYLISQMSDNTRIIVIDNVMELNNLQNFTNLDITSWQSKEFNDFCSLNELLKNALRSNPDWVILAEARGKEMIDVLSSAETGHPIITTLHSFDIESMPIRMAKMTQMSNSNLDFNDLLKDITYHIRFYIYLKRVQIENRINRYISEIGYYDGNLFQMIYEFKNNKHLYYKLSDSALSVLDKKCFDDIFINIFTEKL